MVETSTTVNSWNEWDPLTHVMVGYARGTMVQAPEPAVTRDWPEHGFPRGTYGPLPDEMVQVADDQLNDFARMLEKRGVRVDRPAQLDFSQSVSTPEWTQDSMFGCMPPRDVLIVFGNELLEATMSYRSRWFEYLCYRPLVEEYYRDDPSMRWEAAPKPRLTAASYKDGFWEEAERLTPEESLARTLDKDLLLTEAEPLFDAADIVRFGKDIFIQPSLVTNSAGIRWLRQHLPNHRVHEVIFEEHLPQHIDATWVPLRPGLVLHCGDRPAQPDLLEYLRINDWEVVEVEEDTLSRTKASVPRFSFCSHWLAMNVLSLDAETVCVEASETGLMEQLDTLGFDVVPVPFWDVAPFGGGLHCATVDIHREGAMEDYFPKRHGRF